MRRLSRNCLFFNSSSDISLTIFSSIFIFLIIIFLFICLVFKFDFSVSYSGIVLKEDDFYVGLVISDNDIQLLQENVLVVDKEKKDFSIYRIDDDYVLTENGPLKRVYLKFEFSDNKKVVNNVLKLTFIQRKTIFQYLKERV